ncbi:hypothetical protein [Paraburkholderia kururiensis]|uniref:hypothetical protein n=1 Tax=Paraburkholderia kururiensis TaxID=984307 RepID=UPI000F87EE8C|nr:hypothetical protein [Paraburkholderia kururiensis]
MLAPGVVPLSGRRFSFAAVALFFDCVFDVDFAAMGRSPVGGHRAASRGGAIGHGARRAAYDRKAGGKCRAGSGEKSSEKAAKKQRKSSEKAAKKRGRSVKDV